MLRKQSIKGSIRKVFVLILALIVFTSTLLTASALEWEGDSETGSLNGRPAVDNSFWVKYTDDFTKSLVAWRFTYYDKDGNLPYEGEAGDDVSYVEVWLTNNSYAGHSSKNYSTDYFHSVVPKYSKRDYYLAAKAGKIAPGSLSTVSRNNSAARTGCWLENSSWLSDFNGGVGFYSALPRNPSEINTWCQRDQNMDIIARALGNTRGLDGMAAGDVIIVEPVYWQMLNSEVVAATPSEFASLGAYYCGLDSNGYVLNSAGSSDGTWGFTRQFTNYSYPRSLYTVNSMGLWDSAEDMPSVENVDLALLTMRDIMQKGYGVGIAFSIKESEVTYTVKYNGNGATGGSTASSTHVYGTAKNLTANGFTKTGYTFNGWNTRADGKGTAYADKASVKNLTSTNGATVNLYAQWKPNTYTVKYDANGGTGTMADTIVTYGTQTPIRNNTFTRTGYTFTGSHVHRKSDGKWLYKLSSGSLLWYAEGEQPSGATLAVYNQGQYTATATPVNGDVITLYAQWQPIPNTKYTVNHYLMGLDGAYSRTPIETEALQGATDSSIAVSNLKKTYNGFTYSHGSVDGVTVTTTTIPGDGRRVVNLYYSRNKYSVSLDKEAGISEVTGEGTYYYGQIVKISAVVEEGYTWSKWVGDYNTSIQEYTFVMPSGNVRLVAVPVIYDFVRNEQLRFIKDMYFDTLLANSKWRTGPLSQLLRSALSEDLSDPDNCEQVWKFTSEEYEAARKECLKWKKGREAIDGFLALFGGNRDK